MDQPFLESAIAAAGLADRARTWDFLVHVRAVGNREDVRRAFVSAEGGLPTASRVVHELCAVTLAGRRLDPGGARAAEAYRAFVELAPPPTAPIAHPFDQLFCTRCGARTSIRYSHVERCGRCAEPPLDIITLLVELGHSSATVRSCAICARAASLHDPYCYYCGAHLDG